MRRSVLCPDCDAVSARVHSRYERTPRDLPWSQWQAQLVVHARRFFCDNDERRRRIFAERFPGVLEHYARQTERLQRSLLELAYSTSAEMAARVGKMLGYVTSGDTLIRRQRQDRMTIPVPRILGVDDFALRRGQTYATILIDLERRQPVDIIDGRHAEPLADWLRSHPQVDVIARDRSHEYALAGRTASPDALQVADRFHLAQNVNESLLKLLRSQRWIDTPGSTYSGEKAKPTPRMRALWEDIQRRKNTGQSYSAIARELGINRQTVRKYLDAERPPVFGPRRPQATKLMPYLPYLRRRWLEGCHNARTLYKELVRQGYDGPERKVRSVVQPWRSAMSYPIQRRAPNLRWTLLRPYSQLTQTDRLWLDQMLQINPDLGRGHYLKESFQRIFSERDAEALDVWIDEASESGIPAFKATARSIMHDYDAVQAALLTPWSTGQCEGQICRVKLIKRQGYGRAKLDLLRQRVLHRTAAS